MKLKDVVILISFATFVVVPSFIDAAPKPKGKLTIVYSNLGNETLDTVKRMAREEEAILFSLGEGLVLASHSGEAGARTYYPAIATSWKVSPDLATWEFTIRKDVKFHDGTPVTMEDIIYTWKRALTSPESLGHSIKRSVESVEAIGDDRVVFRLKEPTPFHLYPVASYAIQPKAYTEKIGEKAFATKPIYAGPWKLVKQVQGDYVEMVAFEGHYRKVPAYKSLLLKIAPEPATQLAMLKTGEADILFNVPVGPAINELKKDPNLRLVSAPVEGESYGYFVNLAKKERPPSPFWDKRVRHAFSYAINRQLLVDKIYYGLGRPSAATCLIPGTHRWHPSVPTVIPYDVEKAKALLKEAGYPNGLEVDFYLTKREKTEGEAIASMWAKAGIRAKIKMWETGALLAGIRKRNLPDGVRISRHKSSPGGIWYYFRNDQTYTNMIDDKLDRLTRKMGTFPEGPEMDKFIRDEMCRYVADLMPAIPIINLVVLHGVSPGIDTTVWEQYATRHINYVPAAEYLKPK
jgi:peptide/nickel transport system substrate-binding protein